MCAPQGRSAHALRMLGACVRCAWAHRIISMIFGTKLLQCDARRHCSSFCVPSWPYSRRAPSIAEAPSVLMLLDASRGASKTLRM